MKTAPDNQILFNAVTKVNSCCGLDDQAKELVTLVATTTKSACVSFLYLNDIGDRFEMLACKPVSKARRFSGVSIDAGDPTVKQILDGATAITRDNPLALQLLRSISLTGNGEELAEGLALIVPVISGPRLTGLIFIDERNTGEYSWDDIALIQTIAAGIAPGMEKEYVNDRLRERERELTVLNKCCSIIAAGFDIADVYDEFAAELKKCLEVDWTAIMLTEDDMLQVFASYSDLDSTWLPGESMPVTGTASEWVMATKMPLVEADLKKDSLFVSDIYHVNLGIRAIVCVPLLVNNQDPIGSLIVGSKRPDRYNQKQVEFLREVAASITTAIRNARLYEEVLKKSRYDELTGLMNRRSLDENIMSEVNRHSRYGGVFSIIFLDLDSMKYINDHFGHLAGDGLLARTGGVIKDAIRSVDQAFRYGGDEFAILLPNTPGDAAVKVSERIRKEIAARLVVDEMTVTASFGLASWPANGPGPNDIVAAADTALYKAKSMGGNRSCSSDDPDQSS